LFDSSLLLKEENNFFSTSCVCLRELKDWKEKEKVKAEKIKLDKIEESKTVYRLEMEKVGKFVVPLFPKLFLNLDPLKKAFSFESFKSRKGFLFLSNWLKKLVIG
jgi:hypothetical protein